MRKYLSILIPALCAVAVFLLLRTFFLLGYVPTESMEPTLEKGSYILGTRIYGELKVGDIVIFEHEERLLIKRISAGPGDTIEQNGTSLVVPENCYYVLGDNPANSYDSRFWEDPYISRTCIIAKVILPQYE